MYFSNTRCTVSAENDWRRWDKQKPNPPTLQSTAPVCLFLLFLVSLVYLRRFADSVVCRLLEIECYKSQPHKYLHTRSCSYLWLWKLLAYTRAHTSGCVKSSTSKPENITAAKRWALTRRLMLFSETLFAFAWNLQRHSFKNRWQNKIKKENEKKGSCLIMVSHSFRPSVFKINKKSISAWLFGDLRAVREKQNCQHMLFCTPHTPLLTG